MVGLGNISGWQQPHGLVTTWMASLAAREAARSARRSDIPPSFQRAQHLREAYNSKSMGTQLPRLMVVPTFIKLVRTAVAVDLGECFCEVVGWGFGGGERVVSGFDGDGAVATG